MVRYWTSNECCDGSSGPYIRTTISRGTLKQRYSDPGECKSCVWVRLEPASFYHTRLAISEDRLELLPALYQMTP